MKSDEQTDTIFVTKCMECGNQGYEVVRYSVCHEDCECVMNDLTYDQLKELTDFLSEFLKKEKGGAQ